MTWSPVIYSSLSFEKKIINTDKNDWTSAIYNFRYYVQSLILSSIKYNFRRHISKVILCTKKNIN